MPAVPLIATRTALINRTGCTEAQAELAIKRAGWNATADQFIAAVEIEQAISLALTNGVNIADALLNASDVALAA